MVNKSLNKLIFIAYIAIIISLFLYSFTQVDLGLTIVRNHFLHGIENAFQYIGYFERPMSTLLYCSIVSLLFIFYGLFLFLSHKGLINRKFIWTTIIVTAVILAFSYNAFSYDLFNYIFDSKIITHYHANPYQHKALDYLNDPMLGFMHWTQRTYPYGPVWLAITVPLSFIGINVFLVTFFLFKILMAGSYVGTVYFLEKILDSRLYKNNERKRDSSSSAQKDKRDSGQAGMTNKKIAALSKYMRTPRNDVLFSLVFFALNPLVIIECLVSAHNDIVMMFFAMWGTYLFVKQKYVWAGLLLLLSIGIKFATVLLIPSLVMYYLLPKKKTSLDVLILLACMFMIIAVGIATFRTNFQPWYLLYVLPFAAFVARKFFVFIPLVICSFFALGIYIPFLLNGNWNPPIPMILIWIQVGGVIVSIIGSIIYYVIQGKENKNMSS